MVKAKFIISKDDDSKTEIEKFDVLFNPNEYKITSSKGIETEAEIDDDDYYTPKSINQTLSLELFFDTYGTGKSVREYTDKLQNALLIDESDFTQRICTFIWGDLKFTGLVESITESFIMFQEDGKPVRAKISLSMKYYVGKKKAVKR